MEIKNPQRHTTERGIKSISCRWSHADYVTSIYKLKNGGIGRVCDCPGFWFKRKCKHVTALKQWAIDSAKKRQEEDKDDDARE